MRIPLQSTETRPTEASILSDPSRQSADIAQLVSGMRRPAQGRAPFLADHRGGAEGTPEFQALGIAATAAQANLVSNIEKMMAQANFDPNRAVRPQRPNNPGLPAGAAHPSMPSGLALAAGTAALGVLAYKKVPLVRSALSSLGHALWSAGTRLQDAVSGERPAASGYELLPMTDMETTAPAHDAAFLEGGLHVPLLADTDQSEAQRRATYERPNTP